MNSFGPCPWCTSRLKGKRAQAPYLKQRIEGSGSSAELVLYCSEKDCGYEKRGPKPNEKK